MPQMEAMMGSPLESRMAAAYDKPPYTELDVRLGRIPSTEAGITGRYAWSRRDAGVLTSTGHYDARDPTSLQVDWAEESASAGGTYDGGIGGDANTVWETSSLKVQELDPDDLQTVLRTATSPASPAATDRGIGGTSAVIWYTTPAARYELSVVDFSIVRGPIGGTNFVGFGGDSAVIWAARLGIGGRAIEEDSVVDFSIVQTAAFDPGEASATPSGSGGNASEVFACGYSDDPALLLPRVSQTRSPSDLSIITSYEENYAWGVLKGIGG